MFWLMVALTIGSRRAEAQTPAQPDVAEALVARIHGLELRFHSIAVTEREIRAVLDAATSYEQQRGFRAVFQVRVHALHAAQRLGCLELARDIARRLQIGLAALPDASTTDIAHIASHTANLLLALGDAAGAASTLTACREALAPDSAAVTGAVLAWLEVEAMLAAGRTPEAATLLHDLPTPDLRDPRQRDVAANLNVLRMKVAAAQDRLPAALPAAERFCADVQAAAGAHAAVTLQAQLNLAQGRMLTRDIDGATTALAPVAAAVETAAAGDIDLARLRVEVHLLRANLAELAGDLPQSLLEHQNTVRLAKDVLDAQDPRLIWLQTGLAMQETVLRGPRAGRDRLLEVLSSSRSYHALREGALSAVDARQVEDGMALALRRLLHTRDREDRSLQDREELEALTVLRGASARRGALMSLVRRNARAVDATANLRDRAARRREEAAGFSSMPGHEASAASATTEQDLRTAERDWLATVRELPGAAKVFAEVQLDQVAARLPAGGAALLTMTFLDDGTRKTDMFGLGLQLSEGTSAFVYLLLRDGSVQRFELGPSARVERLCGELRTQLVGQTRVPRGRGAGEPGKRTVADAAASLARLLAKALAAIPDDTTTLLVCADGPLASIPWTELPHPAGKPLGSQLHLVYADNLPALERTAASAAGPSLLAVGGVDFGRRPDTRDAPPGDQPDLAPLPGTLAEARTAAEAFAAAFPAAPIELLSGDRATRDAVVDAMRARRFVHLATHARIRGGQQTAELLLAGANADAPTLTEQEVASLDLSDCELVVLAACDTNVGPRGVGQAVSGLTRALHEAGVRDAISTLWPVDDQGSATFFRAFYRELWGNRRSIDDAMQTARDACAAAGFGAGVSAAFVHYCVP